MSYWNSKVGDLRSMAVFPPDLYHYLQDSQDVKAACESVGMQGEDTTGAIERLGEGEIIEVWITHYSAPWRLDAVYERIL